MQFFLPFSFRTWVFATQFLSFTRFCGGVLRLFGCRMIAGAPPKEASFRQKQLRALFFRRASDSM